MKYLFLVFIAILLLQGTLAKKKNKKKSSSSSSSSGEEKKGSKKCPVCPPQKVIIVKEVAVCEGESRLLECPAGHDIAVVDAFYGRRNRVTCPHEKMDNVNCSASSALDIVKSRCDNNEKCDVTSANDWFSDPCRYTYKYLEVGFTCQPNEWEG